MNVVITCVYSRSCCSLEFNTCCSWFVGFLYEFLTMFMSWHERANSFARVGVCVCTYDDFIISYVCSHFQTTSGIGRAGWVVKGGGCFYNTYISWYVHLYDANRLRTIKYKNKVCMWLNVYSSNDAMEHGVSFDGKNYNSANTNQLVRWHVYDLVILQLPSKPEF